MTGRTPTLSRLFPWFIAVAFGLSLMLALPYLGAAQGALATKIPAAEVPATLSMSATAIATSEATTRSVTSLPETGSGDNSREDIVLVLAFTSATVLGLAGLAVLDRKPEI